MKTKQICREYFNTKKKIKALQLKLKYSAKLSYSEKLDLEQKMTMDKMFIAKVDEGLKVLREITQEHDYEMFYLKYFQNKTLNYLAITFGYAGPSSFWRRLDGCAREFEDILNT